MKYKKRRKYLDVRGSKAANLDNRILTIRGNKVILDADLAEIYGVTTKALNQAVKRNERRFPRDFSFVLNENEKSKVVTECDHLLRIRFSPVSPRAFTEHGAIMAATILNSPRAVQMSVFVVRAFVQMRSALSDTRELAAKLNKLESELTARLDGHEAAIIEALQRIMKVLDPPARPIEDEKPSTEIWFHVKEDAVPYRVTRTRNRSASARNGSA